MHQIFVDISMEAGAFIFFYNKELLNYIHKTIGF